MALEEQGVPSVAVHTHVFARLVRATAQANGMPKTRQAFVPQPVVDKSAAELRAYVEGVDPVSRRPFMQEVIEGLTGPLDAADLSGLSFDRSTPRLLEPDTEENLRALFEKNHWTDCLPIVLPTEERVAAMLKGTSHQPDKVVGRMRPTSFREFWEYTVEKVAVNAVMAGAKPEYFSVILALASTGETAKCSSTTSMTNLAVVNGPIREEIGMNCGIGAMGPYSHANATIGRAYQLLSQNLQGGSVPDESYMGTLGNPFAYSFCFAENEERSPWEPLHVTKGMKASESAFRPPAGIFRRSSSWTRSWRGSLKTRASTRSASSSTGARKMPGFRRANIGTTSGCRRFYYLWRMRASSPTRRASRPSLTTSSRCSRRKTSTS